MLKKSLCKELVEPISQVESLTNGMQQASVFIVNPPYSARFLVYHKSVEEVRKKREGQGENCDEQRGASREK